MIVVVVVFVCLLISKLTFDSQGDLCRNPNLEVRGLVKTASGRGFMFAQDMSTGAFVAYEVGVRSNLSIDLGARRPATRSFSYELFKGESGDSNFEQAIEIPNTNSAYLFYSGGFNYRKVTFDVTTKRWRHDTWMQGPSWCGHQHGYCVVNSAGEGLRIHLGAGDNFIPYERFELREDGEMLIRNDKGHMALLVDDDDNAQLVLLLDERMMMMTAKVIDDRFQTKLITGMLFTERNTVQLFSKTRTVFHGLWHTVRDDDHDNYDHIRLAKTSFADYFQCHRQQPSRLIDVQGGDDNRTKVDQHHDVCKLNFISIFIVLLAFNFIVFVLFSLLFVVTK